MYVKKKPCSIIAIQLLAMHGAAKTTPVVQQVLLAQSFVLVFCVGRSDSEMSWFPGVMSQNASQMNR